MSIFKNGIRGHGFFNLKVVRNGKVVQDTGWQPNIIVNASLPVIAGLVGNVDSQTAFSYIAVGTSNTAANVSQTALVGEISTNGLTRASATLSRVTTTVTNDTTQFYKEFTVTGSSTVQEVGVFNASSSGTMLCRAVVTSTSVVNGDKLQVTYKVSYSDDGV